jgi:hypothetical protein
MVLFPLDPAFASSNLAEDDGLLREIKIYRMTSTEEEIKPSASSLNILWNVKEPC